MSAEEGTEPSKEAGEQSSKEEGAEPSKEERIAAAKAKAAAAKAAREAAGDGTQSDDPKGAGDDEKADKIAAAKARVAAAAAAKKKEQNWPYPASFREPKDPTDLDALKKQFGAAILKIGDMSGKPVAYVDPLRAFDILRHAKEELGFDHLPFLSACDYVDEDILELHWQLYAYPEDDGPGRDLAVKAHVPRDAPTTSSVTALWAGADWHEREAYDMFGIKFEGHPNLTRIFMPEGWRGYPLRKDYDRTPQYIGMGADGEDIVYDTPGPNRW